MDESSLLQVTPAWRAAHPAAAVGVLALRGVTNPAQHPALDQRKAELEQRLRERYAGLDRAALAQLPVLQAYAAYYKCFRSAWHRFKCNQASPVACEPRIESTWWGTWLKRSKKS